MRRQRAAAPLLAALLLTVAAGSVTATEPLGRSGPGDRLGDPPTIAPTGEPSRRGDRDDAPTFHTEAVPGDFGKVLWSQAPYGSSPGAIYGAEVGDVPDVTLAPGGTGFGASEGAWSPGGQFVAFSRDMTTNTTTFDGDIWIVAKDGSGLKRLTNTVASDRDPDWFPDGSRIVFYSNRTGNGDIYSMKIDGSDVRRLTTHTGVEAHPTVSPDGKKIAFAGVRSPNNLDIYVMNVDGSNVQRVTTDAAADYWPDWSPDGTHIAFTSERTGDAEIFSMTASGASQTNLTQDATTHDFEPSWSPDGGSLLLWSPTEGTDADVWLLDLTTFGFSLVAGTFDDEWSSDWQPIPAFPLVDAKFSSFHNDIVWVYEQGITVGCSAERYCPDDPVTREQMAIFLDRALDLPATATDYFSDDAGRSGEGAINRLRAAGITAGCGPTTYCPTAPVTRGQMASFLVRALALPTTTTDYFTDDETSTHESDINRLRAAGITSGCTPTTYCPTASVTRGQMAAFLRRGLEE